jgi:hypothetical protein
MPYFNPDKYTPADDEYWFGMVTGNVDYQIDIEEAEPNSDKLD